MLVTTVKKYPDAIRPERDANHAMKVLFFDEVSVLLTGTHTYV